MKLKFLLVIAATTILSSCSSGITEIPSKMERDIGNKITFSEAKTIASNLNADTSKYSKIECTVYCESYNVTDGIAKETRDKLINLISEYTDLDAFTKVGDSTTFTLTDQTSFKRYTISSKDIDSMEEIVEDYTFKGSPFYIIDIYANGNNLTSHLYTDYYNLSEDLKQRIFPNAKEYDYSELCYYNTDGLYESRIVKIYEAFNDNSIYEMSLRYTYNWIE